MKVKYEGYNDNREKAVLEVEGELVKETDKQLKIKHGTTEVTINKSKIISRDDVVLSVPKENNVVTLDNYSVFSNLCQQIVNGSKNVLEGFLRIGRSFKIIEEKKLYLLDGYSNFYEFCEKKFNYKETSVKNMIAVYKKYKDNNTDDQSYFISVDEKYEGYSYTALVEMLPIPEKEIQKRFTPDMSVNEIRKVKSIGQLTDELKTIIFNYDHVFKLLSAEVENFNNQYNKKIIKINKKDCDLTIENYYQRIAFEYRFYSYYLDSSLKEPLEMDYQSISSTSDEDIVKRFNNRFIKKVKEDLKKKEKEKEEKQAKKEEVKEYEDIYYYEFNNNGLAFLDPIYYYFVMLVLRSVERTSTYYFRYFYESKEYKKELIYNEQEIGLLCINVESQYIYLDLKDCDDENLKKKYHFEKETLYEVIYNLGDMLIKYLSK